MSFFWHHERMPDAVAPVDPLAIDYRPLVGPVSRDEVRAFRSHAKANGVDGSPLDVRPLVLAVVLALFLLGVIGSGLRDVISAGTAPPAGMIVVLIAGLAVIAAGILFAARASTRKWERWMRLSQFAQANRMHFATSSPDPGYPGMIFTRGDSRRATDHMMSTAGRFFDLGNYQYTTGSGRSRRTSYWGFLAFKLDRNLPNMVLDSRSNNGFFGTNLPESFGRNQVLSLEGDFDKHFTLYAPKEYERDALYLFTPDLMALLIDEASPFDVEIVDDWMFIYSARPFDSLQPASYQRLFSIMATVGAKTLSQSARYSDDRAIAPGMIAPQGARLRRGVSVLSVVAVIGIVAYWIWSLFFDR